MIRKKGENMENPFKKSVNNVKDENSQQDNDINTAEKCDIKDNNETELENVATEPAEESSDKNESLDTNDNKELEELKIKYETLNNQYIRLAADFDNFRKRQEQERENLLKYGAESTVKKLIEVMDNFDRGLKAIETVEDCEKVKECYNLAYKNFNDVMTKIGVNVINAVDAEFDPNLHEAVMRTPTDEKPENTVIEELQKGYMLGDKVLRPTLVRVATAE